MATVEFTIRETIFYTGSIEVEPEKWEALHGDTPLGHATDGDFQRYLDRFGVEHEERHGFVDGQEWFDFEVADGQHPNQEKG